MTQTLLLIQVKLKFELKAFTLHCSFVINVADFISLRHDSIQVDCVSKNKRNQMIKEPQSLDMRVKAFWSLDINYYLVPG